MSSPARLLLDGPASPERNMAVDEALLRHVQTPVLRIYGWDTACFSIGYFQKISVVPSGHLFVRRYTGGGLVEHGRDLTYTLVLPADHSLTTAGTLPSYRSIHQSVAQALQDCGVPCHLATAQPKKDDPSCFLKPVPADVLNSDGLKLAGAAQRRTKQGCLHQGSILLPQGIHGCKPACKQNFKAPKSPMKRRKPAGSLNLHATRLGSGISPARRSPPEHHYQSRTGYK
ncbi:MAG: lipoate--protein ligase family protein [Verrucomicrobia bacterium]|nr:lipoate--protein ligase family protein [Verrucomicrobiota bacterium]